MPPLNASKLAPWHRRAVVWSALAVGITGLLWMALYYAVVAVPAWDGPEARSRLHLVIVAHGIAGYAGAIVLGGLLGRHVPAGLSSRRKLFSGVSALVLAAGLIVTALLLYYAGGAGVRAAASVAHQVFGVAAVAAVAAHVTARVRAPKRASREAAPAALHKGDASCSGRAVRHAAE